MPSRMIDFDSLWTSDKLAACRESVRAEYTWLYGLADANGTFEINVRAIHSRVSAIRPKLSAKRISAIFDEFHQNGLLFKWTANGKTYGFWTGSDRKGRLPTRSERHRYKRFAPDVPIQELTEYESRFTRDGVASTSPLGVGVELGLDRKGDGAGAREGVGAERETKIIANARADSTSEPQTLPGKRNQNSHCGYCNQAFPTVQEFIVHRCSSKTSGGHECIACHKTFPDFRGLRLHRAGCAAVAGTARQASEVAR